MAVFVQDGKLLRVQEALAFMASVDPLLGMSSTSPLASTSRSFPVKKSACSLGKKS